MDMHLDEDLLGKARETAKRMIAEGSDSGSFSAAAEGESSATMVVKRSNDGIIALGTLEEGGQSFYIGLLPL